MFHSLDDYRDKNKDEKKEKDKRKTTDSYAGGKSSGIAVMNPEDEKKNDWINKLKAEEAKNKGEFDKTKNKIKLSVYKNGFVIDDGEFRDIKLPENKKFMEQVHKGYIPQELVSKGYKDLGIELEDHKDDNYEPPKEEKKFQAFVGQGQSLGGVSTQGLKVNANVSSIVDKSKPTCKVNIRLFNGQVVNEEFNLCQTLGDVYKFVEKKSGSSSFDLLEGFPPKPLTDKTKTIEQLKIMGSMLTQKIK